MEVDAKGFNVMEMIKQFVKGFLPMLKPQIKEIVGGAIDKFIAKRPGNDLNDYLLALKQEIFKDIDAL